MVTGATTASPFVSGYRSLFRFALDRGETVPGVAEQYMRDWLRARKGKPDRDALDLWDGSEDIILPSGTEIEVIGFQDRRSGDSAVRYKVTDRGDRTDYLVSITALSEPHSKPKAASFIVDVSRNSGTAESAVREIFPPRIIPAILEQRRAYNGGTRLQGRPRVIRPGDVDELVAAIADQDRQIALVVASAINPQTEPQWSAIVDRLTRNTVGVAAIFVVSASAVEALNNELPEALRTPPGHIRTIAPKVVFENPDARRHPLLSPTDLSQILEDDGHPIEASVEELSLTPKRLLLEGALPPSMRRVNRLLDKQERKALLSRRVAAELEEHAGPAAKKLPVFPSRRQKHGQTAVASGYWTQFQAMLARWLDVEPESITDDSVEVALQNLDERIVRERESLQVYEKYLSQIEEDRSSLQVQIAELREAKESESAQLEASQEKLTHALQAVEKLTAELNVLTGTRHETSLAPGNQADPAALEALEVKVAEGAGNTATAATSGISRPETPEMDIRYEVGRALEHLSPRLESLIEKRLAPLLRGLHWTAILTELDTAMGRKPGRYTSGDPAAQLRIVTERLGQLGFPFDEEGKRVVSTVGQDLRNLRNRWSHYEELDSLDAFRAHDQVYRLLSELGDVEGAAEAEARREKVAAVLWPNGQLATAAEETASQPALVETASASITEAVLVRADGESTPIIGAGRVMFEPWQGTGDEEPEFLDELWRQAAKIRVRAVAQQIVEAEGPIQLNRLLGHIAREFGYRSLHDKRAKEIETVVRRADILLDGDEFAWPRDLDPRDWQEFRPNPPEIDRNFLEVSPIEIRNAANFILATRPDISRDGLELEVLRTFGRKRRTNRVSAHLQTALEDLG